MFFLAKALAATGFLKEEIFVFELFLTFCFIRVAILITMLRKVLQETEVSEKANRVPLR